ncbi:MAG: helix-turn-helix domain containing protein [Terracidiphilus sp.]|nr:helix-turn-helix domain containing protein [Terracidiphilus sp.]MDR3776336.1 helix-turn-helix domain containing protein [Terracidiphilus sp.]
MLTMPKNLELRGRIVQAAAQLFACRGYHGTSTREVARLAGVPENTLFRHFGHKEDLFWSALRLCSADLNIRVDVLDSIAECETLEVAFPRLVGMLRDTLTSRPDLLRIIAVAFLELPWKAEAYCREYFAPIFLVLNRYLAEKIESNKMRDVDPTIVTVALVMTVMMHPWILKVIDTDRLADYGGQADLHGLSRFWLDVLTPTPVADPGSIAEVVGQRSF